MFLQLFQRLDLEDLLGIFYLGTTSFAILLVISLKED